MASNDKYPSLGSLAKISKQASQLAPPVTNRIRK